MNKNKKMMVYLFLLGLGMHTKVYLGGIIAFSELWMFVAAPFVFLRQKTELKKNGLFPICFLSLLMIVGTCITCNVHDIPFMYAIKGGMMYYSIFASVVVLYSLLSKEPRGLGWFCLGLALSKIITIFAFDPRVSFSVDGSQAYLGQLELEEVMTGPLFWFPRINSFLSLPIAFAYMHMPFVFTAMLMTAGSLIAILTTVSGRSASALSLLAVVFVALCKRSRKRMKLMGRYILLYGIVIVVSAVVIKNAYVYSAKNGILGEDSRIKYENQVHGNDSFLGVLMGGRTEFFIAIRAMFDEPIIGIGPIAIDRKGYALDFMQKYGTEKDLKQYCNYLAANGGVSLIPQHSSITQFWGHAGISGLIFWLYVLWQIAMYFKRYASAIPHWFGYLVPLALSNIFTIFFNPYNRSLFPIFIVMILMCRAVYYKKILLPYAMEKEVRENE